MNMSVTNSQAAVVSAQVEPSFSQIEPDQQKVQPEQGIQPPQNSAKVVDAVQNGQSSSPKEQGTAASEEIRELAEVMNDAMDDLQTSLGFSISENLPNQVVVEIKNRETGELVRQIPAEQLISIKEKMDEFTGMIFDASA